MTACDDLAETAARVAASTTTGRGFLLDLGAEAGGVRRGPLWVLDAATGGSNRIRGRGFRRPVDDGTNGQARHFAGTVAVAARIGLRLTRWLSIHVGGDAPESADGRLTENALDFVGRTRDGRLAPNEAATWIRTTLCLPSTSPTSARQR